MIISRLVKILAIITSLGTYLILLMGSLVTNTGSGQGCGNSWPFCHGQIIPGTITVAGIIEYSHRIMSSIDGFLVVALTIVTWLLYRRDFQAKLYSSMSLFFVLLQGALGALTVVFEGTYEKNYFLSVHFGFSLIALASVILLTIRIFQLTREPQSRSTRSFLKSKRLPYLLWGLAAFTYIVVYTGALVEHTGALAGCGRQFPSCGSTYLPDFSSLAGIQVLHRFAAASLWLLTLVTLFVAVRYYREQSNLVRGAWIAFILITLQAGSGILTVVTGGQMIAILLHITIISFYFSVLCYLCMVVGWPWHKKQLEQSVKSQQLGLGPVS